MRAKEKVFYWVKLYKDFLDSDIIDFLMSKKNGANYFVLYLKLVILAINTDGELATRVGEQIVPFTIEKIRRECKLFNAKTIENAIVLYRQLGLIYEKDNGILCISNFEAFVGSNSYWAERKAIQREKIGQQLDNVQQPLISNSLLSYEESNSLFAELYNRYPRKGKKEISFKVFRQKIDYLSFEKAREKCSDIYKLLKHRWGNDWHDREEKYIPYLSKFLEDEIPD